ncbi:MAG: hypothetical protein ACR2N2_05250 [Acidimicrobiia bacterium]
MSKSTSNESRGNDGSWFLEAVGAAPKQQKPSETLAELEAENTEVGDKVVAAAAVSSPKTKVEVMSFDGDPGTSTSSFAPVAAPPPPPPAAPPPHTLDLNDLEAPPPAEAMPDADEMDDTELSPALRSRRNFRWPVVVGLLAVIVAIAAAAWFLPKTVESAAAETRQGYADAAIGVRQYLPTAQEGLDVITDPSTSTQQVAGSVPVIAELDTRAFALETATAEPLPSVPPLVPSGPVDALVPLQDTGAILGAASSDLATSLGNAYIYRTSIPLLLDTGPLPVAATTQEVNEISVQLASSLASDAGIVADLPEHPSFESVRQDAIETLQWYADWQDDYLSSLTGENVEAATELVAELEAMRTALNDSNQSALLEFRADADLVIVELAGQFDVYLQDLSQGT